MADGGSPSATLVVRSGSLELIVQLRRLKSSQDEDV